MKTKKSISVFVKIAAAMLLAVLAVVFAGCSEDPNFKVTNILVNSESIGHFSPSANEYHYRLGYNAEKPKVTYEFAGRDSKLKIETTEIKEEEKVTGYKTEIKNKKGEVLYMINFSVLQEKPKALVNSLYRLQNDKELNVAYFGGSVTNASGWRVHIGEWLTRSFLEAKINNVNCSIGGTGSIYGVYRLQKQMLDHVAESADGAKPDLVFIEYAINDSYESVVLGSTGAFESQYNSAQSYVNIESMIRKIYAANPKADIVFIITGDNGSLLGEIGFDTPKFGTAYTKLAEYYNIPIIYVGRELALHIYEENGEKYPKSSDDIWKKYYNDIVHPTELGHNHYANTIIAQLREELPAVYVPTEEEYADKKYPDEAYCIEEEKGSLITDADMVYIKEPVGGFTAEEKKSGNFTYYTLVSQKAGDSAEFEFNSTDLYIWIWCYSEETDITYSIDGGEPKTLTMSMKNPNHSVIVLARGLDTDKKHTIKFVHEDDNRFEIRSFMLSGMPEGQAAELAPVVSE